ncbi:MAG: hypothetical protein DSY85_01080 [Marinomonas sp.]|nr:MAG: hypothetical protein DSY85_01080 [Marinomonas sp.]
MTYPKTDMLRQQVIETIAEVRKESRWRWPPAYKLVCQRLTEKGIKTGYGRRFDPTTLYAFLRRSGYSGIWGVTQEFNGAT